MKRRRILLGEKYRKRVAFVRNGMLITDNLYRLQRFPGLKDFVAVVECQSKHGNESSQHGSSFMFNESLEMLVGDF